MHTLTIDDDLRVHHNSDWSGELDIQAERPVTIADLLHIVAAFYADQWPENLDGVGGLVDLVKINGYAQIALQLAADARARDQGSVGP